jgi:hypothetical protein
MVMKIVQLIPNSFKQKNIYVKPPFSEDDKYMKKSFQ